MLSSTPPKQKRPRKSEKSSGARSATPRRALFRSLSSTAILYITISIITVTAILISFIFVRIIKEFLIENRTATIFSLIEQQSTRHLDSAVTFSSWESPVSQQKFKDFEDELLGSYRNIAALELHTPQGVLVWASVKNAPIGDTPEKDAVEKALTEGNIYNTPSASTVTELGIQDLIEVYVPIRDAGSTIGVAEVYLDLSDIVTLLRYIGMILWVIGVISTILIFFILRFAFQYRDTQIIDRTAELESLAKNLEKKVRERTAQIEREKIRDEALLASLGEGMIATDNKGVITVVNHTTEKILKWHESEMIGKRLTEAVPAMYENGEMIPDKDRVCLKAIRTGKPATTERGIYFIKKYGSKIPVIVTANPVVIGDTITGAVIVFRDITREKELEETRRNLLSLASHQLRTPLSGTRWLIETLQKGVHGPLTAEQKSYLDEIHKVNDRMSALVHDMMGVLRIEGNVDPTQKERVTVGAILKPLLETLDAALQSKHITIKLPQNTDREIETDCLMLRNILECLVSNAINYSNPGGEVAIDIKEDPTGTVFSIRDAGIGIPESEQHQIFGRFYRASNAKTFDTHGTGLGLYIASMLAKKIGVLLSFDSTEGKGTTFYVHVPLS